MRCINCPHCIIEYNKNDTTKAEARCGLLPTARTKGRLITWSMDLYRGLKGTDRIKDSLSRRNSISWCPHQETIPTKQVMNIIEYLDATGKPQGSVADMLGVSDSYISKLKEGIFPVSPDLRKRFYDATGIKLIDVETPLSRVTAERDALRIENTELKELVLSLNTQLVELRALLSDCVLNIDTYDLSKFNIKEIK